MKLNFTVNRTRPLLAALSLVAAAIATTLPVVPAEASTSIDCSRGLNLSFEEPVIPDTWRPINESAVPGWETEAPDGMIEFWIDGFLGFSASEANQFSELQANGTAAVYQDIPTAVGDVIAWTVDHRGRATTEEARVQIGAPGGESTVQQMITNPDRWVTYGGSYTVSSDLPTTRFMLRPIGSGSVGNLVDNVTLALTCGLDATASVTTITDVDGSGSDTVGDTVTVTTSVTNTGTATLLDLSLSDAAALVASCDNATLAPGVTTTCSATYAVDQPAMDAGQVAGAAEISARDAANISLSDTAAYSLSLVVEPRFSVALDATIDSSTVSPEGRMDPGDTVHLHASVMNTGNVTLTDIAAAVDIAGVLECSSSTIAPGASTSCTSSQPLTQADIDSGSVSAVGLFLATTSQGTDLTTTEEASVAVVPDSDLTVGYRADPGTYDTPGESIGLTVSVRNTGNTTLQGIRVIENLADTGGLDCGNTPFSLAPQEERVCTAARSISQSDLDAGRIEGVASADGQDPQAHSVSASPAGLTVVAEQQPTISIAATSTVDHGLAGPNDRADVGDSATVIYTITNRGNVTLSNILLDSALASAIDCPSATLAPLESHDCVVSAHLGQTNIDAGMIDGSASVIANTPDTSTISSSVEHIASIGRAPGIEVETTADSVTSNGNGTYSVTYSVSVTNLGNTTLSGIEVDEGLSETFPDATVTPIPSGTPVSPSFAPDLVLQPGETITVTYTAQVSAGGDPGPYTTNSNATAISPVGQVSDRATEDVTFDVSYDLVVTRISPPATAPGATYSHVFTITNTGPAAAFGPIALTMNLDPSTPFDSYSGDGWTCSTKKLEVTCTLDKELNADAATDLTINVAVNAMTGETPTSQVRVGAMNHADDTDLSSNALSITLAVEVLPTTGLGSEEIGIVGLLLLLGGVVAILVARRRPASEAARM